jgi:hypothetical protein
MRICCICGTKWKGSHKEKYDPNSKYSLIYGCHKCQKGDCNKPGREAYYRYGEIQKESK